MNTITKGVLVIFLISMGGLGFAQSSDDVSALSTFLPEGKLSYLQTNNPTLIAEMAYINKHGYYLSDMEGLKDIGNLPDALLVPQMYNSAPALTEQLLLSDNFNLLAYQFHFPQEEYVYYRVGNSDKVLVILPRKQAQLNFTNDNDAE